MTKKATVILVSAIVLVPASVAIAGLFSGGVDPLHGFPSFYRDANDLVLQPCLATNGSCGPADEVPTTFPNPVFYWVAQARMYTYGGKGGNPDAARPGGQSTATLTMHLAGTYPLDANGDRTPVAGQELVLQSMEFRVDSLLDGELYTVTTPFGVFDNIPANVNFNSDGSRGSNSDAVKEAFQFPPDPVAPGNFDQSSYPTSPPGTVPWTFSGFDRFLTCAGGPQPSGFLAPVPLGEPGMLECTIEGSPLGPSYDVFRVEGPEVGGGPRLWAELSGSEFAIGLDPWVEGQPSIDSVETTQFLITGQVLPPAPVPFASWPARGVFVALLIAGAFGAQAWLAGRRAARSVAL